MKVRWKLLQSMTSTFTKLCNKIYFIINDKYMTTVGAIVNGTTTPDAGQQTKKSPASTVGADYNDIIA
jgi:hypothetical protein